MEPTRHDPLTETWRGRQVLNAAAVAELLGVSFRTFNSSYRTDTSRFETPMPGPLRYPSDEWGSEARMVTLTHPDTREPMWDALEMTRWARTRPGRGWRAARTS